MGRWRWVRDAMAVLLLLATTAAGLVAWYDGTVDIGVAVEAIPAEQAPDHVGRAPGDAVVIVSSVVPDGNAVRRGIHPEMLVTYLDALDGRELATADEPADMWGEPIRLPTEGVPSNDIAGLAVGYAYEETLDGPYYVEPVAEVRREWLEERLRNDIFLIFFGLVPAAVLWTVLRRGVAGPIGRQEAVAVAVAVAVPFVAVPLVEVGNPIGIVISYAAVIGAALLLGLGLAVAVADATYRRVAVAASVALTVVAGLMVWLHMTTPHLSPDERFTMFGAMGAVAFAPAAIGSLSLGPTARDRATLLSLGLVPVAALTLLLPPTLAPLPAVALPALLVGWHLLPWPRISQLADRLFSELRSGVSTAAPTGIATAIRERRDILSGGLLLIAAAVALTQDAAWALVVGGLTAGAVWFGARRGVLGADWTDAAMPLATSVGVPIFMVPATWEWYSLYPPMLLLPALAALLVAHVLAERHTEAIWRLRLLGGAALLAIVAVLAGGSDGAAILLLGLVPLVPGLPVAFADRPGAEAFSWRLETLAVALTPGIAAAVMLPGGAGVLLLGGWMAIIVVWRYLAILPLVGLATRTQLQRDLAVAAAETERARLAADLHDDALQQLTMLVRTLDESGQTAAADEAREIAGKLRSVVGDLRLPLLDDLGAGAALEWLVERVGPLAGGAVTLERSDLARPPAAVELAVFRVAQEALTNAIRHGRPPISVRYDVRADGRVSLAIDDAGDGIGPQEPPSEDHFGLASMAQRAEQIGALLDVRRWPAGGTRVALDWRPG